MLTFKTTQPSVEINGERYTAEKKIGSGAAAHVYLARRENGNSSNQIESPDLVILKEIRAKWVLRHIKTSVRLRLLTSFIGTDILPMPLTPAPEKVGDIVAFNYVEGQDLSKFSRHPKEEKVKIAFAMARQILEDLKTLQDNALVHCDIRPPNILWNAENRKSSIIDIDKLSHPYGRMYPEFDVYGLGLTVLSLLKSQWFADLSHRIEDFRPLLFNGLRKLHLKYPEEIRDQVNMLVNFVIRAVARYPYSELSADKALEMFH